MPEKITFSEIKVQSYAFYFWQLFWKTLYIYDDGFVNINYGDDENYNILTLVLSGASLRMLIPIPQVFLILPTTKDISEMKRGQTIKRIERIKTIIKISFLFLMLPTTNEHSGISKAMLCWREGKVYNFEVLIKEWLGKKTRFSIYL